MSDPLLLVDDNVLAYVQSAARGIVLLKMRVNVKIVKTNIDSNVSQLPQFSLSMGVVQLGYSAKRSSCLELTLGNDNSMPRIQFFFRCPVCNGTNGTNKLPIESFKYKSKCFAADCLLCKTLIRVAMNAHWCSECKERIDCILTPMSTIQISEDEDVNQETGTAV